jgi:hypothetical protein
LTTTFSPDEGHPAVAADGALLLCVGIADGDGGGDDAAGELAADCGLAGGAVCPPEARDADPHAAASTAVHSSSAVVAVCRAANGVMRCSP